MAPGRASVPLGYCLAAVAEVTIVLPRNRQQEAIIDQREFPDPGRRYFQRLSRALLALAALAWLGGSALAAGPADVIDARARQYEEQVDRSFLGIAALRDKARTQYPVGVEQLRGELAGRRRDLVRLSDEIWGFMKSDAYVRRYQAKPAAKVERCACLQAAKLMMVDAYIQTVASVLKLAADEKYSPGQFRALLERKTEGQREDYRAIDCAE